ncbi:MAG: hypothetical protein ABFQ95_06425 [Pseudomonadota bacterium]
MALAGAAHAVPCLNKTNIYKGPAFFADQKFDSLTISGPGNLQGSTILGKTIVQGPFSGTDCKFQDLDITGPLTLNNSSFTQAQIRGPVKLSNVKATGRLSILGPLEATKADLQDVVIQTQTLSLMDSQVRSLKIKDNRSTAPQRLLLKGTTTVGQITFELGNGIVVISGDTVVAENIKGARVERSSN